MTDRVVFAIPGDLKAATGGYAYDRRMIAELRALGWSVGVLALPGGFPMPSPEELRQTASAFADLPDGTLVLVDGLAFGAMPQIAADEAERLKLVALVHHPLGLETGLGAERAAALTDSETRALQAARCVVATSATTARTLQKAFGVVEDRMHVAPPGTEPGPAAPGVGEPPVILCVGSLVPRKGQDVLVEALAGLTDLDWRCRIVGSTARDPAFSAKIVAAVEAAGLTARVSIPGEVADARAEMGAADIFALPTRLEGYGMVFAEAMVQGLPVVGCAVGAVPEVVPQEAGLLVPPDDAAAFAQALRALLEDAALRRAKADGANAAAVQLPTWSSSARSLSAALSEARS